MAELLTYGQPWDRITALVKKQPKRCCVAVAYFGKGASKLLPLGKGSTLAVDLSERAVRSSQTNPKEVLKLVNKGVDAYSVHNLHAKIFVIGQRAVVGSSNASNTSANGLVEAAVDTTDRAVVSACRRFIMDLCGEPATPEYLKRLQKLWRDPQFGLGKRASSKGQVQRTVPKHATLWVVPLRYTTYDPKDKAAMGRSHARAKRRIRSSRLFLVDDFKLDASQAAPLRRNDLVVEVLDEGKGIHMVRATERILDIEPYSKGRARRAMVSVECARKHRRMDLVRVLKRLPPSGRILKLAEEPKKIGDALLAHALMGLWTPSLKS